MPGLATVTLQGPAAGHPRGTAVAGRRLAALLRAGRGDGAWRRTVRGAGGLCHWAEQTGMPEHASSPFWVAPAEGLAPAPAGRRPCPRARAAAAWPPLPPAGARCAGGPPVPLQVLAASATGDLGCPGAAAGPQARTTGSWLASLQTGSKQGAWPLRSSASERGRYQVQNRLFSPPDAALCLLPTLPCLAPPIYFNRRAVSASPHRSAIGASYVMQALAHRSSLVSWLDSR